jgi:hypothetical protein
MRRLGRLCSVMHSVPVSLYVCKYLCSIFRVVIREVQNVIHLEIPFFYAFFCTKCFKGINNLAAMSQILLNGFRLNLVLEVSTSAVW